MSSIIIGALSISLLLTVLHIIFGTCDIPPM
jgi:hypothetical protein